MATKPADAKAAAPKKSATKPAAAKSRAPKQTAPAAPPAEPMPASTAGQPVKVRPAGGMLKVKDLVEAVQARTTGKKKETRAAVEATLAVIGEALGKGQDLNLPPLGRAKVGRHKEAGDGELLVVKIKRGGPGKPAKKLVPEGVAETGE